MEGNRIAAASFALMSRFDSEGHPIYARGTVESAEDRETLLATMAPLRPVPHSITSVVLGEVKLMLEDGREITLRPVFRPTLETYRDLFFVGEEQYPMPPKLAELLERWRTRQEGVAHV
jgi:hypothetical protein